MDAFVEYMRELNIVTASVRLILALLIGGIVGLERGRVGRAAGMRTHILVSIGAALTAMIGFFIKDALGVTGSDPLRVAAQVISGIGFLGVGTIFIKGRFQITGLTTAAGLWASACMGLAIGAGFYIGALVGCILIILTVTVFGKIEYFITSRSRNMTMYIEFDHVDNITEVIERIKSRGVRVFDVELVTADEGPSKYASAILIIRLPKKLSHTGLITEIAKVDSVRMIEEL